MNASRWMGLLVLAPALAAAGAAPGEVALTLRLDRAAGEAASSLFGESLPAPGAPGAAALLSELLPNGSFELTPPGESIRLPREWGEAPPGWELRACGSRHVLVRTELGTGEELLLARRKRWRTYRVTTLARKIGGPGGLGVILEPRGARTRMRWTLGALGNRYHVLEWVRGDKAEQIAPPVVGRIKAGRCYKIEVARRKEVLRCLLNGRLIHRVNVRRPGGGFGFAAADATAEFFDVAAYGEDGVPLFLLDDPAKATRDTLSTGWEPLRDARNDVAYKWDSLYPFNSFFSQSVKVHRYVGGDAGIVRRGVPVAAGTTCRGRVHLRAQGRVPVVVALRSRQGRVYASRVLGEPGEAWRAFDFALKPGASDPAADFCLTVTRGGTVWVDQVSLTAGDEGGRGGLRRDAVEALRGKQPEVLAWPMAAAAAAYDWRDGIGLRDERPVAAVLGDTKGVFQAAPNDFGTKEFLALCRALGAEPLLVLHPRLGLRPGLAWLEYCNAEADTPMGKLRAEHDRAEPYGVRLWAVGGVPLAGLDARAYVGDAAAIAHAMREQDPAVRVVALLFDAQARRDLVSLGLAGEAPPRFHAAAARSGDQLLLRIIHLGRHELEAAIGVAGLGGLRLAGEATHLRLDDQPETAEAARAGLRVTGDSFRLTLRPQATHIVALRLEGKAP